MLNVFGDESADETKQRVFAVAGIIGPEEAWEHLQASWNIRTKGIPFHANNCDSDQGDYARRPHAENKALYRDLAQILAASELAGWAFVIDLAAQRKFFPDAPDIAYYKAFLEVLHAMRNCAANNDEKAKFTFDNRQESQHNAGELYRMVSEQPEWRDSAFPEISFACSRDQPRIQVADLFAREAMKVFDNRFGPVKRPVRKSWLALLDTGRFHVYAISDDWFRSLSDQMPKLQEATGMSAPDYLQWLKERRLQHNMTTLFRYTEWKARKIGIHETSR